VSAPVLSEWLTAQQLRREMMGGGRASALLRSLECVELLLLRRRTMPRRDRKPLMLRLEPLLEGLEGGGDACAEQQQQQQRRLPPQRGAGGLLPWVAADWLPQQCEDVCEAIAEVLRHEQADGRDSHPPPDDLARGDRRTRSLAEATACLLSKLDEVAAAHTHTPTAAAAAAAVTTSAGGAGEGRVQQLLASLQRGGHEAESALAAVLEHGMDVLESMAPPPGAAGLSPRPGGRGWGLEVVEGVEEVLDATSERVEGMLEAMDEGYLVPRLLRSCSEPTLRAVCTSLSAVEQLRQRRPLLLPAGAGEPGGSSDGDGDDAVTALACVMRMADELERCVDLSIEARDRAAAAAASLAAEDAALAPLAPRVVGGSLWHDAAMAAAQQGCGAVVEWLAGHAEVDAMAASADGSLLLSISPRLSGHRGTAQH
jgi:hypothetical protein